MGPDNSAVRPELLDDGRVEPRQHAGIGLYLGVLGDRGNFGFHTDLEAPSREWMGDSADNRSVTAPAPLHRARMIVTE